MTYDRTTVVLHWLTAILVMALWIVGQTADWIPDGPLNTGVWSVHVVTGFALIVLLGWRIVWRVSAGRRLPDPTSRPLTLLAKATQCALYVVLCGVLLLGVINAFVRGYNLFDLFSLPQIGDKASREVITDWHGLLANILLALAGLHAIAALTHHYVFRDGVLIRMIPNLKSRTLAAR